MKPHALLTATLAIGLASCSSGDTDAGNDALDVDEASEDLTSIEVSGGTPGTYEITMEDGTITMSVLSEDGTYVDSVDGEVTESGLWVEKGEQLCFDPEGELPEYCMTNGVPDEDGVYQSTSEDGTSVTVRKVL